MRPRYSYESCLRTSERVYWSLAEAIQALDFDFAMPFLPDRLVGAAELSVLSDAEKLQLNQIRAHSYAHLFLFVEEFIIPQAADQAVSHLHTDPIAMRAMLRFCEEELKHQELFRAVKARFTEGFGHECAVIDGMVQTAKAVCQRPAMSVLLLTSMLEWITQRHYLECFRSGGVDAGFAEVFRLHWVEEAQHAKLDTLELKRLLVEEGPVAANRAVDDLDDLCGALDELLCRQAELDLETLQRVSGRPLRTNELDAVREAQVASYRWTFVTSGLDHPIFQKLVAELDPGVGPERLQAGLERFAS